MEENFKNYTKQELKQLDEVIKKANDALRNVPEGSLRVTYNHNTAQYYWRNKETKYYGKYIRKSDKKLIDALAQKEYASKILARASEMRENLLKYDSEYDWAEIENLHKSLGRGKQELIQSFIESDDVYAQKWEQKMNIQKNGHMNIQINTQSNTQTRSWMNKYPLDVDSGIITERGDLVRSKSEKIIADKLYLHGIPYIYECPLMLKGWGYVHPDFTVLNKKKRQVFYWEHFGMMDYPEYCEKAIKKIRMYEKNRMFQGRKLIVSYETAAQVINVNLIDGMIKHYLK